MKLDRTMTLATERQAAKPSTPKPSSGAIEGTPGFKFIDDTPAFKKHPTRFIYGMSAPENPLDRYVVAMKVLGDDAFIKYVSYAERPAAFMNNAGMSTTRQLGRAIVTTRQYAEMIWSWLHVPLGDGKYFVVMPDPRVARRQGQYDPSGVACRHCWHLTEIDGVLKRYCCFCPAVKDTSIARGIHGSLLK